MELKNPSKEYKSTYSLVYSCQYHIIFCPKYRRKVLINGIDERLNELILEKQKDYGYEVIEMEVMPDHVHLLLDINPQYSPVKVVSKIKGYTAHVLRKEFPPLKSRLPCLWTRSKFVSTVGSVSLEVVKKYIEEQKGK
ncbi:IS200/IS605 family transposase [Candidatus Bathyarchaeota archaeon]|nr:MAG: IS200/IS605 family transposase [Candidatus Bathyarchaeota archaeon]